MRIHLSARLLILTLSLVLSASRAANAQAVQIAHHGMSSAEALRDRGIDLSEPSLLIALHHPDARVRTLAAAQFAADHRMDAIPDVERALADEKDRMTRIGLASALASLHDPLGLTFLEQRCADPAEPDRSAIVAAQTIEMLHAPLTACVESMLIRLHATSSGDYRDALIPIAADLHSVATKDQAARIVDALQRLLIDRSEQPSFRLAAAQGLAQIEATTSIPFLQDVIADESDPVLRATFLTSLEAVQKSSKP